MFCKARVRIDVPNGLHLRPASRIAEAVADYPGEVRVKYRDRVADAQSVIDLLSLGVPEGGVVMIEADRASGEKAVIVGGRRGLATFVAP